MLFSVPPGHTIPQLIGGVCQIRMGGDLYLSFCLQEVLVGILERFVRAELPWRVNGSAATSFLLIYEINPP